MVEVGGRMVETGNVYRILWEKTPYKWPIWKRE
jgi:hypothetical protein